MVMKLNVSIPEDVVRDMDQAAREAGTTRSAFLTQAVKHYLQEKEEERLHQRRLRAAEAIDRIREEFGPWDGTAEVLKWREKH